MRGAKAAPKKADLILVLLLAALGLWAARQLLRRPEPAKTASVWREDEAILTLDLEEQSGKTLDLREYGLSVLLQVGEGRVRFLESDCPDKICVNTGWLSEEGQTAVCMPNRVSITIN